MPSMTIWKGLPYRRATRRVRLRARPPGLAPASTRSMARRMATAVATRMLTRSISRVEAAPIPMRQAVARIPSAASARRSSDSVLLSCTPWSTTAPGGKATAAAPDANALESLEPLLISLPHPHHHPDGVARQEVGEVGAQPLAGHRLQVIHGVLLCEGGGARREEQGAHP